MIEIGRRMDMVVGFSEEEADRRADEDRRWNAGAAAAAPPAPTHPQEDGDPLPEGLDDPSTLPPE